MGINHLPILLILAVVALIVFGPKRLPELGHGLGKAITEFKKGTADLMSSHEADVPTQTPTSAPVLLAQPIVTAAPTVAGETPSAPVAATAPSVKA